MFTFSSAATVRALPLLTEYGWLYSFLRYTYYKRPRNLLICKQLLNVCTAGVLDGL